MAGETKTEETKWENLVVNIDFRDPTGTQRTLDSHGAERWELVDVVYVQPLDGITGVAFLKRRAL